MEVSSPLARYIDPLPGGVRPMTTAMRNALEAALLGG